MTNASVEVSDGINVYLDKGYLDTIDFSRNQISIPLAIVFTELGSPDAFVAIGEQDMGPVYSVAFADDGLRSA